MISSYISKDFFCNPDYHDSDMYEVVDGVIVDGYKDEVLSITVTYDQKNLFCNMVLDTNEEFLRKLRDGSLPTGGSPLKEVFGEMLLLYGRKHGTLPNYEARERMETTTVRLTNKQKKTLELLGGGKWLRDVLNNNGEIIKS